MRVLLAFLSLSLLACSSNTSTKEGYATTYSFRDDASPGIVFEATTQRGLSLSDTRDPKSLKAWEDSLSKPAKPFYIRVYADHITARNTESNSVEVVSTRNLIKIDWK